MNDIQSQEGSYEPIRNQIKRKILINDENARENKLRIN